jgi:hypothetical protein
MTRIAFLIALAAGGWGQTLLTPTESYLKISDSKGKVLATVAQDGTVKIVSGTCEDALVEVRTATLAQSDQIRQSFLDGEKQKQLLAAANERYIKALLKIIESQKLQIAVYDKVLHNIDSVLKEKK